MWRNALTQCIRSAIIMKKHRTDIAPDAWHEYRTGLYHFVLKRVHDESAADDIVQDAMTKVVANLESVRDPQKIRQWMYQITRNTIIDYYRRNRVMDELPEDLVTSDMHKKASIEAELSHCCIAPFVAKLPEKYREAIVLSEIDGLTQQEVASQQGLSLSGAKSRVQRGRKMLKEMMLECCHFEQDNSGRIIDYQTTNRCGSC